MRQRIEVVELAEYTRSRLAERVSQIILVANLLGWKKIYENGHYSTRGGYHIFTSKITFKKDVPEGEAQENPLSYTLAGL